MSRSFRASPLFVLVAIAVVAWLAATQLPTLVHEYQQARQFSPAWGYVYLAILAAAVISTAALGGWALWLLVGAGRAKRARREQQGRRASQMSLADRLSETELHLADVGRLADDPTLSPEVRSGPAPGARRPVGQAGRQKAGDRGFRHHFQRQVVAAQRPGRPRRLSHRRRGGHHVTRSELRWPGADHVVLVDTPGLAEVKGIDREITARLGRPRCRRGAVGRRRPLESISSTRCWANWWHGEAGDRLPEQVGLVHRRRSPAAGRAIERAGRRHRPGRRHLSPCAANPVVRTRVGVAADGREIEESVQEESDISALADRILQTVSRDGADLLAANLLLRARGLATDARSRIGSALDRQAEEIVQRAMWQAAAAAALSPLPVIDVAAGLAVTTGMVVSLARVYRQAIDLDTDQPADRRVGEEPGGDLGIERRGAGRGQRRGLALENRPGRRHAGRRRAAGPGASAASRVGSAGCSWFISGARCRNRRSAGPPWPGSSGMT